MYESEDENYLRMAQRELDLGYFESAISFYDKAINLSPNADNYYLKGLAYYNHCSKNYLDESETSDIKSAIQNFSTAISIAPQNAIYYYYRAKANLKFIQNYDYVEVEGDRDPTHDYKLKRNALSFILTDLQKAMNLDSAYEEEYKRFYNSNVEQKFILEDHSIPKKYQLDLNKKPNDKTIENPMNVYAKILSANSDEVKELNKNPNNKGYKIIKYNVNTGICIIVDKYWHYGLSDKDFNIILPVEYMQISFGKGYDTIIELVKKDEKGTPKYGLADKSGKIIKEVK